MKLIKISLLVIFIFFLSNFIVYADIIPEGEKNIDWSYKIANMDDYPDYVFLLYEKIPDPAYKILKQNEDFGFYKLSGASIYAIEKDILKDKELTSLNQEELRDFFENNPEIMPSNLELSPQTTVEVGNPLKKIVYILNIEGIGDGGLKIKLAKRIETNANGAETVFKYNGDKEVQTQETNNTNKNKNINKNSLPTWFIYLFFACLPLSAIIIIFLVFVVRRRKK